MFLFVYILTILTQIFKILTFVYQVMILLRYRLLQQYSITGKIKYFIYYKMNNQEPIKREHMNANIMKTQSINLNTFMLKNTIFIIKKETRAELTVSKQRHD